MKISLLEKRENFFKILRETLSEHQYSGDFVTEDETSFLVNKYLNFIAHPNLKEEVFSNVVAEYGKATVSWRGFIQKIFVQLAVIKELRGLFSLKRIELPQRYANQLILGGNHRIRLFKEGLKSSVLILKEGEDSAFIANDVELRTAYTLDYAPKLLDHGPDWIEEEYLSGIPLNRIRDNALKESTIGKLVSVHFEQLIKPSLHIISLKEYLSLKKEKLSLKLLDPKLQINKEDIRTIMDTFEEIIKKLVDREVSVSMTHGDFQEGNVLVKEKIFKVIDWESANTRFWLYDFFIFIGNIRAHGNLNEALNSFEIFTRSKKHIFELSANWKELLMVEEIFYNVKEDCSPNYYRSGLKAVQLCNQIQRYLSE
jgi:predicted Ser/Thr protein kinase